MIENTLLELIATSRIEKHDLLLRKGCETGTCRAADSHSEEFRGLKMKQAQSVQSVPMYGSQDFNIRVGPSRCA